MSQVSPQRLLSAIFLAACLCLPARLSAEPSDAGEAARIELMQRFYASFEPDRLLPAWRHLAEAPPQCPTGLLAQLRGHWQKLHPQQRHEIEWSTSPYYRGWLANGGSSWREGDVWAAQSAARDTCFAPDQALESLGPYDRIESSQHFAVYFNESDEVTNERVTELLSWLEESLQVQRDELGFLGPNLIESYQLLVAVELLPSPSVGAFTSITPCGPSEQMAFIVINSQWFTDDQRLQSLAPHELFHAIQVRYAFDAFWGNPDPTNQWWIEASAAYQERVVYPELDEIQGSHALQWTREPWRSLQSHDSGGFQYGSYLLAASIHESLDSSLWHQQLWEGFAGRSELSVIPDLDAVLLDHDTSFTREYGQFIERAATMDFEFNDKLTSPAELFELGQGGLVAVHSADEFPIEAIAPGNESPPAPEYLGTSYVQVEAPDGANALLIEVHGLPDNTGASRAWEVRLIATADSEPLASHRLALANSDESDSDNGGTILLDGFGGAYDGLLIAASPTGQGSVAGPAAWSYRLELSESRGGQGFVPVPEDLVPGNGCKACSQGAPEGPHAPGWLAAILLLIALIDRRRRD